MSVRGPKTIHIVGGGLAGCEAAWQALKVGAKVVLHEMRPKKNTEAHKTSNLAELVCSNSFKSLDKASVTGLLKEEMSSLDSLILDAAHQARVPAGASLAVEREHFSKVIKDKLCAHSNFQMIVEEVESLPSEDELNTLDEAWVVASGPLTSQKLSGSLEKIFGTGQKLYFYDAIAPILSGDSIDHSLCFVADRYDRGDADYLNVPLNKEEYETLIQDIAEAQKVPLHKFEEPVYFESCLPIEVMVERGPETLRFGPLKPVGLEDPKTGKRPYACIQLRKENNEGTMYSLVGFQTKLKWPEQKRIFSKIPAFKDMEFFRYGSVHRNTYVNSPDLLSADLSLKNSPRIFLAGQMTGVEGYLESAAIGLLAGRFACARVGLESFIEPPRGTVLGALLNYVTYGTKGKYSPMNANFGLLPAMPKQKGCSKKDRRSKQCEQSALVFTSYLNQLQETTLPN